jgi:superfamily II DNA/RNA helicase
MPPEIQKLTEKFLSNPTQVSVTKPATTAETIDHRFMKVPGARKREALRSLIDGDSIKNAFVFCNRKRDVDMLGKYLKDKGYSAAPLHGDMVQSVRTKTLQDFKDGNIVFLVCSDVAARGLDVVGVSHVFNYDVPINPDDYVHRIGRTGRAGQSGHAWTLWAEDDDKFVDAIFKRTGKDIPVESYKSEERPQPVEKERKFDRNAEEPRSRSKRSSSPRAHSRDDQQNDAGVETGNSFKEQDLPAFLRR